MRGRLAVAILAAVMMMGLTACGGDDSSDAGGTASAGSGTDAAGGACDSSDPIKAGALFSMSGPAAALGELNQQGAEMAIADINADGGILGRCVEEVLEDDGSDPTKAAQAARRLVNEEEVAFVVGPFLSSPTSVSLDVTTPAKVIQMVQSSLTAAGDPSQYPYAFRTEINTDQQAESFLPFLEAHGWTQLGIIAVNNELGTGFVESFEEALSGSEASIVDTQFVDSGTADVTPQMTALKQAGVDVVVVAEAADPDITAVIKARNRLGWDAPLLGFSAMSNAGTMANFSKAEAEDTFAGQIYATLTYEQGEKLPSDKQARDFIAAYKEKLGTEELSVNVSQAAGGYDAFMIAAEAINGAGSVEADEVKAYLETHEIDGVRADYAYSAERHDGVGLDDVTFAIAKSLNDNGVVQIAPGQ